MLHAFVTTNLFSFSSFFLNKGDQQLFLRQSAGFALGFIALFRAEPNNRALELLPLAMERLFQFANDKSVSWVSQVHAINIMKFVFEDSTLRDHVDGFLTQGFHTAIRGFSNNEWSVRNSSLNLFAAISKRALGTKKVNRLTF